MSKELLTVYILCLPDTQLLNVAVAVHAFFECVLNFKHAFQAHSGPCTSELYHMPIESGIM